MKKRNKKYLRILTKAANNMHSAIKSLWFDPIRRGNDGYAMYDGGEFGELVYHTQNFDGAVAFLKGVMFALKKVGDGDETRTKAAQLKMAEVKRVTAKVEEQLAKVEEENKDLRQVNGRLNKALADVSNTWREKLDARSSCPSKAALEAELTKPIDSRQQWLINSYATKLINGVDNRSIGLIADDEMILRGYMVYGKGINPTLINCLRRNLVALQVVHLIGV